MNKFTTQVGNARITTSGTEEDFSVEVEVGGEIIFKNDPNDSMPISLIKMSYAQLQDYKKRQGSTPELDYDIAFCAHILTADNSEELAQQYWDLKGDFVREGNALASKKEYAERLGWNIEVGSWQ